MPYTNNLIKIILAICNDIGEVRHVYILGIERKFL